MLDCQCISLPQRFGPQHPETHRSPLPHLICVSVLFMFLLGEKPRRPCRKEREDYNSTGDLMEMNEGI